MALKSGSNMRDRKPLRVRLALRTVMEESVVGSVAFESIWALL